jgi:hypothetical protein
MIIQNEINKKVDNSEKIRLFFKVDAENGVKAGILSLQIQDFEKKLITTHRRQIKKYIGHYRGFFYFDVKKEMFDNFINFDFSIVSFSLSKKITGTGIKTNKFEDLTNKSNDDKLLKKLETAL